MVVFLLNGFVFISIGLQLPTILRDLRGESLGQLIDQAALVGGAVIGLRIVWVFLAMYVPRLFYRSEDSRPSWKEVATIAWAGMRGVVSLAAAFALPFTIGDRGPFPGRNYLLFFTFSVILATLVLQGLTLPLVIRVLGIRDDGLTDEEERSARLAANAAAVEFIGELAGKVGIPSDLVSRLRAEYDDRVHQLEGCCDDASNPSGQVASPQYQDLQQQALQIERNVIIGLRNNRVINDEALRRIQRDLDLAEARITGFW
jgi:CPA1 family monovalent cation:H+ antiporter